MAQHERDDIVISRFKFLRTIENLAWIRDSSRAGIGGFLDLDCFENQQVVEHQITDKQEIVKRIREQLLVVGPGTQLFRDDYEEWLALADAAKPGLAKSQETVSILRSEPVAGVDKLKLREFIGVKYENPDETAKAAGKLAVKMARQIDDHGDHRVKDSAEIVKQFYQEVVRHVRDISIAQENVEDDEYAFIRLIAELLEIDFDAIDMDMTVGELGDLGHFAVMLRIYNKKPAANPPLTVNDVKPDSLPSWSLRVYGSDFEDRNLAGLIPYLDSCEVDKRTHDNLRKVQCNANCLLKAITTFDAPTTRRF